MKIFLLLDFDGTITVKDVTTEILKRYAKGDWKSWDEKALSFKVPVYKALSEQFRMVKVDEEMIKGFIDEHIKVRKGFKNLIDFLKSNEIPYAIVSEGFDLYIDHILRREGINDYTLFSYHAFFDGDGYTVEPRWIWSGCTRCGTCKRRIVKALRHMYKIAYVGDSVTDFCVADYVHYLFVRGKLKDFSELHGIDYIPYNNFLDVLKKLKELVGIKDEA